MAARGDIDLARLGLRPGEGRRLDVEIDPGELEFGGQRYGAFAAEGRLEVSRMAAGHALRLRFATELEGPCMRCLAEARIPVAVDAREVEQAKGDDEIESPYVEAEVVRISDWAHDALALAVPAQLLCRAECAGLCPVCGESLNDSGEGEHDHAAPSDPRWSKLRELKLD